jgi:VanZ family protein
MSSKTTARKLSRWQHWYRGALPAYWVYLLCMTHFPRLRLKTHVTAADKVAHVVCFALLAFLFWRFAETFRKPAPPWLVWLTLAWLGLYAALDEWTQGFVGRGTDVQDWLADMLGIVAVLAVLEWRRRAKAARAAAIPGRRELLPAQRESTND